MSGDFLYKYKAIVTNVYDGDSITVDIDLGFHVWLRDQKIRLAHIDTPEIRGEERPDGLVSKEYVKNLILNKEVMLLTDKDSKGKYGRWLATVLMDDGRNLNELLISEGLAKPYGT